MTAPESYRALIARVGKSLKGKGYSKIGNRMIRKVNDNWGLVNFQADSRQCSQEQTVFTVEIGTCSKLILDKFAGRLLFPRGDRPAITECQYRERLGHLTSARRDVWYTLVADADHEDLFASILADVEQCALPALEGHITDEQLRDCWLALDRQSLFTGMCLLVLLDSIGPREKVPDLLQSLKNDFPHHPMLEAPDGSCLLLADRPRA